MPGQPSIPARRDGRPHITRRIEREVFELFVAGHRQSEIARLVRISKSTVTNLLRAKYQFPQFAGSPECSPDLIAAVAARHLEVERERVITEQERIAQRYLSNANNKQLSQALDLLGRKLSASTQALVPLLTNDGGAE